MPYGIFKMYKETHVDYSVTLHTRNSTALILRRKTSLISFIQIVIGLWLESNLLRTTYVRVEDKNSPWNMVCHLQCKLFSKLSTAEFSVVEMHGLKDELRSKAGAEKSILFVKGRGPPLIHQYWITNSICRGCVVSLWSDCFYSLCCGYFDREPRGGT